MSAWWCTLSSTWEIEEGRISRAQGHPEFEASPGYRTKGYKGEGSATRITAHLARAVGMKFLGTSAQAQPAMLTIPASQWGQAKFC